MRKLRQLSAILFCSMILFGCSKEANQEQDDHVFKTYENALEKARQVQPQLEEADEKRRKQLDDMQ